MRIYVMTTGVLFGLLTCVHLLRMLLEDHQLASDPFYLLITTAMAGMGIWAWRLLRVATGIGNDGGGTGRARRRCRWRVS